MRLCFFLKGFNNSTLQPAEFKYSRIKLLFGPKSLTTLLEFEYIMKKKKLKVLAEYKRWRIM